MQIAIMKDGQITVGDYRDLFPNQTWPGGVPSDEWIEEQGWRVSVFKPHDSRTEKLMPADPYVEDGMVYTVQVEAKTQEEIDADTASRAAQMRARRDAELARSDWRVIKAAETGVALDAEWAAYRQALRDITVQPGFPDVELPKAPDYVEMTKE